MGSDIKRFYRVSHKPGRPNPHFCPPIYAFLTTAEAFGFASHVGKVHDVPVFVDLTDFGGPMVTASMPYSEIRVVEEA